MSTGSPAPPCVRLVPFTPLTAVWRPVGQVTCSGREMYMRVTRVPSPQNPEGWVRFCQDSLPRARYGMGTFG